MSTRLQLQAPARPRTRRRRCAPVALTVALLLAFSVGVPRANAAKETAPPPPPFELREVRPGVHVALQPHERRFNDSNAVILINDRDVIVVDAQSSTVFVKALIEAIGKLTDRPVSTVIYTHWHSDHTQGSGFYEQAFGDGVVFIGHDSLAEEIPERARPQLAESVGRWDEAIEAAEQRLEAGGTEDEPLDEAGKADLAESIERTRARVEEMKSLTIVAPDLTYSDELTLHRGKRAIRLLHRPGHTRGDTVIFLPADKVLITGDLVDDLPYGGHGYPRRWLDSMTDIEQLDFEVMIPGHGSVRDNKEHLRRVIGFHSALLEQVENAVARGRTLEQTEGEMQLEAFKEALAGDDAQALKAWDDFVPATVERAWLEAHRRLPD